MGSKYTTKYDNNPPPGLYNTDQGFNLTKTRGSSTFISTTAKEGGNEISREKGNYPELG